MVSVNISLPNLVIMLNWLFTFLHIEDTCCLNIRPFSNCNAKKFHWVCHSDWLVLTWKASLHNWFCWFALHFRDIMYAKKLNIISYDYFPQCKFNMFLKTLLMHGEILVVYLLVLIAVGPVVLLGCFACSIETTFSKCIFTFTPCDWLKTCHDNRATAWVTVGSNCG